MWYHWRETHNCSNFEQDDEGRCLFCRLNDLLIEKGLEVIPYDTPGAYPLQAGVEHPPAVFQALHYEHVKPS